MTNLLLILLFPPLLLVKVYVYNEPIYFLADAQSSKIYENDFLSEYDDGPKVVAINQCKKMFDNKLAVFIDARDSLLYDDGHILGAINIYFESNDDDQIFSRLEGVEEGGFLIIYSSGGDCDLTEELGNHLFEYLGYTNILLYEGGFPEWKENGYEINYSKHFKH